MKSKYIAVIYEGDKTEKILFENIKKTFLGNIAEIMVISFPAGENIYMLYKQLKKDLFETDLIELLREYNPLAKEKLVGLERKQFSEIYLFFDYDGHNDNLNKESDPSSADVLEEMLSIFDNETELGKLYINYPMVESLRDNKSDDTCFRRCSIPINEIGNYKNRVTECKEFQDFRKITRQNWRYLCMQAVCKANCIVSHTYHIPEFLNYRKKIDQLGIYKNQKMKYIDLRGEIAILNAVPLFLLDYFKEDFWQEMLHNINI